MEQSNDPQTPSDNHTEQHLTNVVQKNADSLQSVHELISHLVGKAPENCGEGSTNSVKFSMPPGYEIDPGSNPKQVILRKKHTVTMVDNGKDDVASDKFEVHISITASETIASIGIPDHAGLGPQSQPGTGSQSESEA